MTLIEFWLFGFVVAGISYAFGYFHGRRDGHKVGMQTGRRVGAFWQRHKDGTP